jgi:hypothetical protein
MGMVRCLQGENRAWRALTERYSGTLRTRETATQTARLETYLAQSEAWRRARCAYHASLYEGGSLSGVIGEDCSNEHSALIAIDLHGRVWNYDHR